MNQLHNIRQQNLLIEVPVDNETESKIAVLNWIQLLEEPFYIAGLTFTGNPNKDQYNGCSSEWILQKDAVVGLKAVLCNLYWTEDQVNEIQTFLSMLNINEE